MKALVATGYMPLDQIAIAEVPTPAPGPGQVLIKVEAAALNPLDLALITGAVKDMYPADHPLVVGMDAAGTVAGVGEGVSGYAQGDPVLAFTGQAGAVAEYTVASPGPLLARRPEGLDSLHAAGIPESGLTAVCLLRAVRLAAGESVLVVGATGGIGLYAVQLAHALGSRVIATATADDEEYLRGLGAGGTVDYKTADVVEETLRLVPGGVDVVVDLVNSGERLTEHRARGPSRRQAGVAALRAGRSGARRVAGLHRPLPGGAGRSRGPGGPGGGRAAARRNRCTLRVRERRAGSRRLRR
nr:NADP-dependent oxidoreductase [Streptomyces lunaelactis]